jgi:hypothetical protein
MTIGTFKGRAKEWALGMSANGKEQVAVMIELTSGEAAGTHITWFGYFTDGAVDRTLDSLRYFGWSSDSLAELDGLDTNEVDVVLDEEEYDGKVRTKVKWINRPARLALKEQMTTGQMAAFAARLRGKTVAHKQKFAGHPQPTQAHRPAAASNGPPPDEWMPPDDSDIQF